MVYAAASSSRRPHALACGANNYVLRRCQQLA